MTLEDEARNLAEVCREYLPRIRRIVEAHPDQARHAFRLLHGPLAEALRIIEAHPGYPLPRDVAASLDAISAELRWLAAVMPSATTCLH
jgi:hypothetical protein